MQDLSEKFRQGSGMKVSSGVRSGYLVLSLGTKSPKSLSVFIKLGF